MTKDALRSLLRQKRRAFFAATDPALIRVHALAMARILFAEASEATTIAAYAAAGYEADPLPFLELAAASGRIVALPAFEAKDAAMRFAQWMPGEPLVTGPFGLPQPGARSPSLTPDLIVAPLVGYDDAMTRLGQGGGHYDRAFAAMPDARRIGLAWTAQHADAIPREEWDIPLHAVVTERGILKRGTPIE